MVLYSDKIIKMPEKVLLYILHFTWSDFSLLILIEHCKLLSVLSPSVETEYHQSLLVNIQ